MGLVLFWLGVFLALKGIKGLISAAFSFGRGHQKLGQVVGFCEDRIGFFQVVLRYKAFNDSEYFLVDGRMTREPPYVMGEFVPILISQNNPKKAAIDPTPPLRQSFGFFLSGAFCVVLQALFLSVSIAGILLSAAIFYGLFLYLEKVQKLNFLMKYLNFVNLFEAQPEPRIVAVDNSKLIRWTENYIGLLTPDLKETWNFQFLKVLIRPTCYAMTIMMVFLAVSSYKNTLNHTREAHQFQGRYDGSVLIQSQFGFEFKAPQIRFYDGQKRVFKLIDKNNPFVYKLKPAQQVTVLVSQKDPLVMRRDLKIWNQWRACGLGLLSVLFFLLGGRSRFNQIQKSQAPPIRIKKAG